MSTRRNVILRLALAVAALVAVACTAHSRVVRGYVSAPAGASEPIAFTVDSIDFRKDLTRVYGRLTGAPHTSNRIDDATLYTPAGAFEATDIDGVDFRRYFQWEDDGEIAIEIDFPRVKSVKTVTFTTVRGKATINIAPAP
ncbi:MAG: hypothetical protein HDR90_08335 [Bacteroides sp.]|nr:hypothetical protein [Bacteroides sp.]MDE5828613.1 hypothetical protein [Duncaniella sp.]